MSIGSCTPLDYIHTCTLKPSLTGSQVQVMYNILYTVGQAKCELTDRLNAMCISHAKHMSTPN